ncbi:MAG: hypothetical protein AAGA68_13485 [Pseudomonadota bacterium]
MNWEATAREVAYGAATRQRAEPSYFSEPRGEAGVGASRMLMRAPARRRRGGDIPESYTNAYGEVEIQVSPDCTARQQRPIEVLDSIDTLPPIIHCKPPPSTFKLPQEIIGRYRGSLKTP